MLLASVASAAAQAPAAKRASSSRPRAAAAAVAAVRRGAPLRKMLQDAADGVGNITPTVVASGPPSPLIILPSPYIPGLTANDVTADGESIG